MGQGNPVFLVLGILFLVSGFSMLAYLSRHGNITITRTVTRRYTYPAEHRVYQRIAFGAFVAGIFVGGIVMLAVVVFYFGVR